MSIDQAAIATLDQHDCLRVKREAFILPQGVIYLDGNSLGPVPKAALRELKIAAEQEWGEQLIRSWNSAGWFDLPATLGDRIARLIGAAAGETVVTDSTSIDIYKVIHAGLNLRPGRSVIVAEGGGFPTDIYMCEGVASVRPDVHIRLEGLDAPRIEDLLAEDVAVVLVNHVDYRTGVLRDAARRLVERRYGLDGERPLRLVEAAEEARMTPSAVADALRRAVVALHRAAAAAS